ncbi:MAG TPA: AAA family ATPase [Candidatus Polarisedimenticolaceae bacterium]|nr:AAA family ATPase [Candidatus Polarisedimenticolaceae bacterium]
MTAPAGPWPDDVVEQLDEAPPVPRDLSLEQSLLSTLLVKRDAIEALRGSLGSSSFSTRAHRLIYAAVLAIADRQESVNAVAVRAQLGAQLEDAGGPAYLGELLQNHYVPNTDVAWIARRIRSLAVRRSVQLGADQLARACANGETDAQIAELAEGLATQALATGTAAPVDLARVEPSAPVWTVRDLIPAEPSLLMLWGGPGHGKSALTLRLLAELLSEPRSSHLFGHPNLPVLRSWRRALYIGSEETAGRQAWRLQAVLRGIGSRLAGELLHLHTLDEPAAFERLGAIVAAHRPLDVVVLDPLAAVRPREYQGRAIEWDRDSELAIATCQRLRRIARDYGLVVLLIHHANKGGEQYRGPVAWGGEVDLVAGLHRDGELVRFQVDKARHGRHLPPFHLRVDWAADDTGELACTVAYSAHGRGQVRLGPTAQAVLAALKSGGPTSLAALVEIVERKRSTVQDALAALAEAKLAERTGQSKHNSPVWVAVVDSGGAGFAAGTGEAE